MSIIIIDQLRLGFLKENKQLPDVDLASLTMLCLVYTLHYTYIFVYTLRARKSLQLML